MRKLFRNTHGNALIGAAVAIFVTIMVSIVIYFSIAGSIDNQDLDYRIAENIFNDPAGGNDDYRNNTTFAANATTSVNNQMETFYSIAPLIGIIVVAVIVLMYVSRIGG